MTGETPLSTRGGFQRAGPPGWRGAAVEEFSLPEEVEGGFSPFRTGALPLPVSGGEPAEPPGAFPFFPESEERVRSEEEGKSALPNSLEGSQSLSPSGFSPFL